MTHFFGKNTSWPPIVNIKTVVEPIKVQEPENKSVQDNENQNTDDEEKKNKEIEIDNCLKELSIFLCEKTED